MTNAKAQQNAALAKEAQKSLKQLKDRKSKAMGQLRRQKEQLKQLDRLPLDATTLEIFTRLLTDQTIVHADLRQQTALLAGRRRHNTIAETLITVMKQDPRPEVQAAAAISLGRQRSAMAMTALLDEFDHPGSVDRRLNAARGLAVARHQPAVAPFIERLNTSSSSTERRTIIQLLGLIRHQDAIGHLKSLLNNTSSPVEDRASAAVALSQLPSEGAIDLLTQLLQNDPSVALRQKIAQAMTPTTLTDAYQYAPLLVATAQQDNDEELQHLLIQNMLLASRLLPAGDSNRVQAAQVLIEIVGDSKKSSNLRKFAASGFKYVDVDEHILSELTAIVQQTRHPILKRLFQSARKQVEARVTTTELPPKNTNIKIKTVFEPSAEVFASKAMKSNS